MFHKQQKKVNGGRKAKIAIAGHMQQRYGTHGANQENQTDQQRGGRTTWRKKLEIYGPEQQGTGMTEMNALC